MRAENYSPLDPIQAVISGPPGTEAVVCRTLPPGKSLFEANAADASVVKARQDHDRMREAFQTEGIQSFNMRQIIGTELAARYDLDITSRHHFLQEVIRRAEQLQLRYGLVKDFNDLVNEIVQLFDYDVQTMGLDPAIAINGVLTNVLDHQGYIKPFDPDLPPAGNFMFWRDTSHITGNQMGTHRMFYPIRDQEVALAQIGFDALGLEYQPVLLNGSSGSIEGGDVIPKELNGQLFSVIGTAERTSWDAVVAWFTMHEKLFSASGDGIIPLVVEGPTSDTQDAMHLDTFEQQIAPGAVIHCGEITRQRPISILMRKAGEIIKVRPENLQKGTYGEWIEQNACDIYDMTRAEQLLYAPNVLVSGSPSKNTTVFITRDGTPDVTRFIRQHALKTVLLKMNELTKFYGGAHCATSEIR